MEKIVLNLMTEKGLEILKYVISINKEIIDHVVIARHVNIDNDFSSQSNKALCHSDEIAKLCELNSLKHFYRGNEPKVDKNHYIFAISWRWMIKHPSNKLIVFHDSLLPKYRGFAPLVNMLINGEEQIGVSAIFGSSEYDKGVVIQQKGTQISYPIKIADAIKINNNNYLYLVEILVKKISKSEKITATTQFELNASYSIWRDFDDYFIDWTQSASEIKRFVDAVGSPYLGARSRISNGDELIIEDTIVVTDVHCELRHVGKVIFVEEGKPKHQY